MRHSKDIISRVQQLEETLEWRPSPNKPDEEILVSTDTTRVVVVARVAKLREGQFGVFSSKYEQGSASYVFFDLVGAKAYGKFHAIKDILEDDLRRATIQWMLAEVLFIKRGGQPF